MSLKASSSIGLVNGIGSPPPPTPHTSTNLRCNTKNNVSWFTNDMPNKEALNEFMAQLKTSPVSYVPMITIWPASAEIMMVGVRASIIHWKSLVDSALSVYITNSHALTHKHELEEHMKDKHLIL